MMPDPKQDESKYVTEVWTYIGKRRGETNKQLYIWLDPTGERMPFTKVKGTIIGALYEVQVLRNDDGSFESVIRNSPRFLRAGEMNAEVAGWRVEDKLLEESLARERLERKAKSIGDNAFAESMKPIAEMYDQFCHTRNDKQAFLAMVLSYLQGWR